MDAEQYFTNHNAYTYNILKLNYNDNIKLMNSKCGYIEIRKHVFDWINGVYILYYILFIFFDYLIIILNSSGCKII